MSAHSFPLSFPCFPVTRFPYFVPLRSNTGPSAPSHQAWALSLLCEAWKIPWWGMDRKVRKAFSKCMCESQKVRKQKWQFMYLGQVYLGPRFCQLCLQSSAPFILQLFKELSRCLFLTLTPHPFWFTQPCLRSHQFRTEGVMHSIHDDGFLDCASSGYGRRYTHTSSSSYFWAYLGISDVMSPLLYHVHRQDAPSYLVPLVRFSALCCL